jgi:hypothetical protein
MSHFWTRPFLKFTSADQQQKADEGCIGDDADLKEDRGRWRSSKRKGGIDPGRSTCEENADS